VWASRVGGIFEAGRVCPACRLPLLKGGTSLIEGNAHAQVHLVGDFLFKVNPGYPNAMLAKLTLS